MRLGPEKNRRAVGFLVALTAPHLSDADAVSWRKNTWPSGMRHCGKRSAGLFRNGSSGAWRVFGLLRNNVTATFPPSPLPLVLINGSAPRVKDRLPQPAAVAAGPAGSRSHGPEGAT